MHSFQSYVLLSTIICYASAKQISRLFDKSLWSEVDKSPIKVQLQLSPSSPNIIQATITNQGLQDTYYPLSTKDIITKLQVYDSNDEPVVRHPPPDIEDHRATSPSQYQMLKSGASIVRGFEVATKYELNPGEQYYIQVGGFMPFYYKDQHSSTSNFQSQIFEANVFEFTPPLQLLHKGYTHSSEDFMTSGAIMSNCSDTDMTAKLMKAIPYALEQAKKSINYVNNGTNRETMQNFFKADDKATKKIIIDRLTAIVKALETENSRQRIGCSEATGPDKRNHQLCVAAGAMAMTDPATGKVSFCPLAKRYPVEFKSCGDSNWGGVLLHELTHSPVVFKPTTQDITYSLSGCKGLSKSRALLNANNYKFLADSVLRGKSC